MNTLAQTAMSATVSGTVASLATTAALAWLASTEGKSPLQPTNSTSHWLHGEAAGSVRQADAAHTLLGYATHHASAIFWAFPFEAWLASRPPRAPLALLRDAAAVSAVAAVVDYGLVPRRLSPGWETVLSKRSVAATFAAMALGLAAGAAISRGLREAGQARTARPGGDFTHLPGSAREEPLRHDRFEGAGSARSIPAEPASGVVR